DGSTPTSASAVYNPAAKPTLANGEQIKYFAVDHAANNETPKTSNPAKVDGNAPTTSATAPASASTTSIAVGYTASDSGSGLTDVELWAKGPSDAAYAKVATDATPSASGESFSYTASQGDGTYQFYTRANDVAGNYEAAPATPDATTTVSTATQSQYSFTGFLRPVDNLPTLNAVKAGQAVPVKFSLGGNHGLSIFATGYPKSQTIPCDSTATVDGIESTVSAGGSSLSYDATTDTYTYVWKTLTGWKNDPCRQLVLKLSDGTYNRANFKFK
ncbi:MAG: PxKF domain-containing protein, partial [Actinomycetota bacterium]|nr:PxKF domain-containing protein [Actinomycetota bacterium]